VHLNSLFLRTCDRSNAGVDTNIDSIFLVGAQLVGNGKLRMMLNSCLRDKLFRLAAEQTPPPSVRQRASEVGLLKLSQPQNIGWDIPIIDQHEGI